MGSAGLDGGEDVFDGDLGGEGVCGFVEGVEGCLGAGLVILVGRMIWVEKNVGINGE